MNEFSEEERRQLEPFVSNLDKPVFALMNLPEVVKGALFSRYSRSSKSLRRVLLDEFLVSEELGLKEMLGDMPRERKGRDMVQTRKAEEFYERVLVGYGDDSVAELAGAHIALEDISIIATKIVEDARIGLSPLEKSTRYVYFDNRDESGRWRYVREKTIMGSEFAAIYEKACDHCFQTYADLIPKISGFVMERIPQDDKTSERAYKSAIRAKTCDILRGLLPASTKTNMGFFGDGRAFEYLLTKMYADDLAEIRDLGSAMQQELSAVIPSFVRRANDKYGVSMQGYIRATRADMRRIASRPEYRGTGITECTTLVGYDKDAERKILVTALYPFVQKPMHEIESIVDKMSKEDKTALIKAYINERGNRRHRPGRAFEMAYYTFDICANFGAYRDLHRHRILTQQRQQLTPHLGYKLPQEIKDSGYENEFRDVMEQAKNAYEEIAAKHRTEAQYVVPLAYNIRWHMTMNLREAYEMLELRSGMQGHADYRHVAQEMFRAIERVHPILSSGMIFMDMKDYPMARLESEKRIDEKLGEMLRRQGKTGSVG